MEFFIALMKIVLDFVQMPFTVFGFTFSMYAVIIFCVVFGLVCYFIHAFM